MILVDTSILINLFRGKIDEKTDIFRQILRQNIPFCISPLTFQEVLQGARDPDEWDQLEKYLSSQQMAPLPDEYHLEGARLYYDLRRKGISIRSTIDILIAVTATKNNLPLLHCDKDFDNIAEYEKDLTVIERLF